jgi:hypothetical protein
METVIMQSCIIHDTKPYFKEDSLKADGFIYCKFFEK